MKERSSGSTSLGVAAVGLSLSLTSVAFAKDARLDAVASPEPQRSPTTLVIPATSQPSSRSELDLLTVPQRESAPKQESERNQLNPEVGYGFSARTLGGISAVILGALGYLAYAVRSTPQSERETHLVTRIGSKIFRNEGFFPGNPLALGIWAANHSVAVIVGVAAALQSGQGVLSSALAAAAPGVFLVGTLVTLPLAKTYGAVKSVSWWARSCQIGSYASLAVFVSSRLPGSAAWFDSLGCDAGLIAVCAALIARQAGLVPFIMDYIKSAALPRNATFPQIKNMGLWTAASAIALTASPSLTSLGAVIPLGYFAQNLLLLGVAVAAYVCHRRRA